MALRDNYSNSKYFQAISPRVKDDANGGTITGVTVDTRGYEAVTFVVNVGDIENGLASASCLQLMLEHASNSANNTGASDFAKVAYGSEILHSAVSASTTLTSGIWQSDINASDAAGSNVYIVGYRGKYRYVRLFVSGVGDSGCSVNIGAVAILGYPANWPVNQPA